MRIKIPLSSCMSFEAVSLEIVQEDSCGEATRPSRRAFSLAAEDDGAIAIIHIIDISIYDNDNNTCYYY